MAAELPDAVPPGDADSKPFWASCARHAMELQRCEACAAFRYPPRSVCPRCLDDRAVWVPVRGTGTVYVQLAVYPRGKGASPEPFSLTIVELDEGVRMWSNVVGCAPDDVRIGDRVRITYQDVTDGAIPRFELDASLGG
jgi:uncharacterized OB-fold protein